MKPLGLRLHVDHDDLTHWEIYDRRSGAILMRVRTCPPPGKHGNTPLSRSLAAMRIEED